MGQVCQRSLSMVVKHNACPRPSFGAQGTFTSVRVNNIGGTVGPAYVHDVPGASGACLDDTSESSRSCRPSKFPFSTSCCQAMPQKYAPQHVPPSSVNMVCVHHTLRLLEVCCVVSSILLGCDATRTPSSLPRTNLPASAHPAQRFVPSVDSNMFQESGTLSVGRDMNELLSWLSEHPDGGVPPAEPTSATARSAGVHRFASPCVLFLTIPW